MGMSAHVRRLRDAIGSELIILPSVSGIVFDDAGRILLVKHRDGDVWSVPGGGVDPEELPTDALVREMWEECGLVTRPVRILGVFGGPGCTVHYGNGDSSNYVITMFECVITGGTLHADSDETSAAEFVGPGDLARYTLSPWLRPILPGLYDRGRTGYFAPPTWTPPA